MTDIEEIKSCLQHGWKLCFAQPKDKNPGSLMGRGWQSKVVRDEAGAKLWLDKCPDANVGVLLGQKSGIVDVEWDTPEGRELLARYIDENVKTPTYQSGKSIHRLFQFGLNLPQKTAVKYRGLEFRIGVGGAAQSIIPPSVHKTGRTYKWLPGLSPADVEPIPMPFELLAACHYYADLSDHQKAEVDEEGNLYVPEGCRHDWMKHRAAQMRNWGLAGSQLLEVMQTLDSEVSHFDDKDREARLSSLCDWMTDNIQPKGIDLPKPEYSTGAVTADKLLEKKIVREFAVDNFMVMGEPMVIGGPSKALKTSIMLDLAVSISTGTNFLKDFKVPRQRPVMVISGESGEKTIQDSLRAIVEQRGLPAERLESLHVSYRLPKLDKDTHVENLIGEMKSKGIDIVFIDPLYRSLRAGESAGNVFSMGEKLENIAERIHRAGITPVLAHHFRKQGKTHSESPDLEDLSQAGIAEFGRQFLLLKRRQIYRHDGNHVLWFQWGGSAGHQGMKILEVTTGTYQTGLTWTSTLRTDEEWEKVEAERKKESQTAEIDERTQLIQDFIRDNPGVSMNQINKQCGGKRSVNKEIVDALIESETVRTEQGPRRANLHFLSEMAVTD